MKTMPAALCRARRFASALLVAMLIVFVVAHQLQPWHPAWQWVRAFAEAALVGGLADWFAVTALFRQPLGLPIPHTAIIPSNKARLADGLAEFLQQNFLTYRVLHEQFSRFDFAAALARVLQDEALRGWLAQRASALAGAQLDAGRLLGLWLQTRLQQQIHQQWFEKVADWAQQLLALHQADIYRKVAEKSPRWMPRRVNDELHHRLMAGLTELLDEMRVADSVARRHFEQALRAQAEQLVADDHDAGDALWVDLAPATGDAQPELLAQQVDAVLRRLAARLEHEPALCATLNRWLRWQAVSLLVRRRAAIMGLVRRIISDWDARTLVDRVEARVGRDLQFIRINGTLVGGLVGLLIHIISITL